MSESLPEAVPAAAGEGDESQPTNPPETDLKAEVDKWKTFARKHEREAKLNAEAAAELRRIKEAGQTEAEQRASLLAQHEALVTEHQTTATERDTLRIENARLRAGLEAKLSLEDMKFIPNGTPEEMKADAIALAARMKAREIEPSYDGGPRGKTPVTPKTFGEVITGLIEDKRKR